MYPTPRSGWPGPWIGCSAPRISSLIPQAPSIKSPAYKNNDSSLRLPRPSLPSQDTTLSHHPSALPQTAPLTPRPRPQTTHKGAASNPRNPSCSFRSQRTLASAYLPPAHTRLSLTTAFICLQSLAPLSVVQSVWSSANLVRVSRSSHLSTTLQINSAPSPSGKLSQLSSLTR